MKKLISMILIVVMMLTTVCFMSACGEDTEVAEGDDSSQVSDDTNPTEVPSSTDNTSYFPEALTNVQAYPVPDVSNTGWELAGGIINGVEMEEADVQAVLTACGGKLQFIFLDEGNVQLVNGEKTLDGTYQTVAENYFIDAVFEGYEYYGVFTDVNGTTALIIVNKTESEKALYMVQIDEA